VELHCPRYCHLGRKRTMWDRTIEMTWPDAAARQLLQQHAARPGLNCTHTKQAAGGLLKKRWRHKKNKKIGGRSTASSFTSFNTFRTAISATNWRPRMTMILLTMATRRMRIATTTEWVRRRNKRNNRRPVCASGGLGRHYFRSQLCTNCHDVQSLPEHENRQPQPTLYNTHIENIPQSNYKASKGGARSLGCSALSMECWRKVCLTPR
jgi:hypothetical protein